MKLDDFLENKNFMKNLDKSIEVILKDNKVDEYDIPELIYIITYTINTEPKININSENLGKVLKDLFNHILFEKLNTEFSDEQKVNLEKLIDSSIKLILLKPKYNKINKCINKFLSCK